MTALSAPTPDRGRDGRRKWLTIALFLLPALALYARVRPASRSSRPPTTACTSGTGSRRSTDFIGLKNYQVALSSDVFWQAVGNNVLDHRPVAGASRSRSRWRSRCMLNRRFPGRAVFRLLFFLPYVLSEAITGIVFRLLLQPDALVDSRSTGVGLGGLVQDWLGDTDDRDAHAVRDHLVEVLRLPHDPHAGRAAGHPAASSRRPR